MKTKIATQLVVIVKVRSSNLVMWEIERFVVLAVR